MPATLIKRYSSLYHRFEMKKLKNGYAVSELAVNKDGEFEIEFRHSGIKSLVEASTEINALVRDMEIKNGVTFKVHQAY